MSKVIFSSDRVEIEYEPLMGKYKVFISGKHVYNFEREDLITIAEIVFGSKFINISENTKEK